MKKIFSTVLVAVLLTISSFGTVFAENNFDGMPDSIKNLVKDNYWAEVQYKSNNPIPKYLQECRIDLENKFYTLFLY